MQLYIPRKSEIFTRSNDLKKEEIAKIKKIRESISILQDEDVKLAVTMTRIRPLLSQESMKTLESSALVFHMILIREIQRLNDLRTMKDEGINP